MGMEKIWSKTHQRVTISKVSFQKFQTLFVSVQLIYRGYYRCSNSKECLARKQVEKNKSGPTTFIVTYTGEHQGRPNAKATKARALGLTKKKINFIYVKKPLIFFLLYVL
jgi:hypothetical protein